MNKNPYSNDANSDHPGHIIFLMDVSESMGRRLPGTGSTTKIERVYEVLEEVVVKMIAMSTVLVPLDDTDPTSIAAPVSRDRFRIALLAYNQGVKDVYNGFVSVSEMPVRKLPNEINPAGRTNAALGFKHVYNLLASLIPQLDARCPAPMVCHLTDAAPNEGPSPKELARMLRKECITPDGPVLVENVYIRDDLLVKPISDIAKWPGITDRSDLVATLPLPAGSNSKMATMQPPDLFDMSSPIPSPYLTRMRRQGFASLREGARLLFPGSGLNLITAALAATGVTGMP